MHDPDVVAFTIVRPWPQRSEFTATGSRGDGVRWRARLNHQHVPGCEDDPPHRAGPFPWWKPGSYSRFWRIAGSDYYWPPLVTVWHREPGGADALSVCRTRVPRAGGGWKPTGGWRWHVRHWRIQIHPVQHARRALLTRCAWCHGRSVKGDLVNYAGGWHTPRRPWWRGEADLYHQDCYEVHLAHGVCLCAVPGELDHRDYGRCSQCGRFRPFGYEPSGPDRWLAALDTGERPGAELAARLGSYWAARRAEAGR